MSAPSPSHEHSRRECYLGIDVGTQGLSVVLVDASTADLDVVAVGEGSSYGMVPNLPDDCYEQNPGDWTDALRVAAEDLRGKLLEGRRREGDAAVGDDDSDPWCGWKVLAVGISGQMHGEVLSASSGGAVGPARLWCDSRNGAEGLELTELFGAKVPKRATVARWLWTMRNQPEKAGKTRRMTTPAGWIAYQLTGEWILGVGEASGMFPIDQETMDYNRDMLRKFDALVKGEGRDVPPLAEMLPTARCAGEGGGHLTPSGADLLGLPHPSRDSPVPIAPAEGDQPAALAGSLISSPGDVACSFGTSVVANSVGDRPFRGIDSAVDHFCAPDGRPINMVWLRNGTTYMNEVVKMFGGDFDSIMPQVISSPPDCGGILALPFMDDEPGLGVARGGSACLVNLAPGNATAGNAVKAALLGSIFNLRMGTKVLDRQGYPRRRIYLSGGVARTPEMGQVVADCFDVPVTLLDSAEEGTAWGAALLGAFQHMIGEKEQQGCEGEGAGDMTWSEFLSKVGRGTLRTFEPQEEAVADYTNTYHRYRKLVDIVPQITKAVSEC